MTTNQILFLVCIGCWVLACILTFVISLTWTSNVNVEWLPIPIMLCYAGGTGTAIAIAFRALGHVS